MSTILFKALWDDEFNLSKTKSETFYSPSGPIQVPYMFQDDEGTVIFGKTFTAVYRALSYGNSMSFILPKEGLSPEELITNKEYQLFSNDSMDTTSKDYIIHVKIPKFDITESYEISDVFRFDFRSML